MNNRIWCICIYCLVNIQLLSAQSYKEYYDLDFKRYNDCSWDWRNSMSGCVNYVDSSFEENILIISKRPNSSHIPLEFDLSKEVVLPDVEGSV